MSDQSSFIHMVYFWLREGGTTEDAGRIAEGCRTFLPDIPGVLRLEVGTPAGTPRAVVDNSYAVALFVEFADQAGHDVYQDHPNHLKFIETCSPFWSRVQVYDSVVPGK